MAQSTWAAISARVKSQMEAITNIGLVHDRLRNVRTKEEWDAISKASIGGVWVPRVWFITLEDVTPTWAEASGTTQWDRTIVIHGMLEWGQDDAAAATAIALAEQVIRKLNQDLWQTKLNGTVLMGKPAKIVEQGPRLAEFVLGYGIKIAMLVQSIDTLT